MNENKVVKSFMKDKEVASIKLDPLRETADIDESNNTWGKITESLSAFRYINKNKALPVGSLAVLILCKKLRIIKTYKAANFK